MTQERTIKVSMNAIMAEAVCAYVDEQMSHDPDEARMKALQDADDKAMEVLRGTNLMHSGTVLYEDDRVILFEHPIHGDEAPIMGYLKEEEFFMENTMFYEVDDRHCIVSMLEAQAGAPY